MSTTGPTPRKLICSSCQAENDPTAENCFTCGKGLSSVTQGSIVGNRYEILRFIGKGGMGMIYKAHDQVLDEVVALKTLRPHIAGDQEMLRRFVAEIKLARKIRHRNVCAIHDYGEAEGLVYISMEFIDGEDLKDVIQAHGALDVDDAYEVVIQIAKGLEAIHDVGVVHRDLKTHNLMRDKRGTVKLLDFGIAKEQNADKGLTGTGQLVGTPEYMSPEQVRGQVVDHRSDLYALAVVAFECFSGEVPFKGDTPIITLFKHLEEPPPLSGPRVQGLPEPLLPVLAKGLAKAPEERFQSATEFIDALRQARTATFPEFTPTPMPFRAPSARAPRPAAGDQTPVTRAPAPVEAPTAASPAVEAPPREPPPDELARTEAHEATPSPPAPPPAPPPTPEPQAPATTQEVRSSGPEPAGRTPPPRGQQAPPPPALEAREPPTVREPVLDRHGPARQPSHTRAIPRPMRDSPRPHEADAGWTPPAPATTSVPPVPAPPAPSSRPPLPLVLGGAAALLVVGVSLALVSSWGREPAAPSAAGPGSSAPPPVEEVVTKVEDPGPAPVEEVVTIVTTTTLPASVAAPSARRTDQGPSGPEAATSLPSAALMPAPPTQSARPVLTLGPASAEPAGSRVGQSVGSGPAPTLPLTTQPAGRPRITQPPTTRPPAPATTLPAPPRARGAFEPGQTRLTSGRAASGPKGFDMTGLEAQQSTEFVGTIDFEPEPAQPRPGESYTMRIYLVNTGDKDVKIRSLTLTTVVDGKRTPSSVTPQIDRLDAGGRALIYAVSGVWPSAGDWAMRAEVVTSKNEKASNYVRWKPAS